MFNLTENFSGIIPKINDNLMNNMIYFAYIYCVK
jgi:hypothetical protein